MRPTSGSRRRRHVHLGDPVAVAHRGGPAAVLHPDHDLLGVDRLARVVAVRPGREGPDRAGVGGRDDPLARRLGDQPVEPLPEPAHARLRRLEVHQRDGQPRWIGSAPAELGPVEPVDLDQPARPVADRHPLELLHLGLVLAERRGDVADAVGGPDLEVLQLRRSVSGAPTSALARRTARVRRAGPGGSAPRSAGPGWCRRRRSASAATRAGSATAPGRAGAPARRPWASARRRWSSPA